MLTKKDLLLIMQTLFHTILSAICLALDMNMIFAINWIVLFTIVFSERMKLFIRKMKYLLL